MHPNPVAPRRRATPADFPALSRGSAAPTFGEALPPKEHRRVSGAVMHHTTQQAFGKKAAAGPIDSRVSRSGAVISSVSPMTETFTRSVERSADRSVTPAIGKPKGSEGYFEAISEAGSIAGVVTGSRVGLLSALGRGFLFAAVWIWNWSQRLGQNKNGA